MAWYGDLYNDAVGGLKDAYHFGKGLVTGPSTANAGDVMTQAEKDAQAFRGLNPTGIEGGLATSLQNTISGNTPSVASGMLANATQANAQQQLGFASGLGGLNAALARRTAADNTARLNQQAARDQSILRAHEISTAQGQLGQLGANISQQQLEEERLRKEAALGQISAENEKRGQSLKLAGAVASGLSGGLGGGAGAGGGGAPG